MIEKIRFEVCLIYEIFLQVQLVFADEVFVEWSASIFILKMFTNVDFELVDKIKSIR